MPESREEVVTTTCASHCGGSCLLRLHIHKGVVTRIDTDDGPEPQLRACARGRAYRQRVYAPDRLLYPLKRVGDRGEGRFERIGWDEALDRVAGEIVRVRETYGAASNLLLAMGGDIHILHTSTDTARVLALAGGFTETWDRPSYGAGIYAQMMTYGTHATCNTRDDLANAKLILMWGWNPAVTVSGVNTSWYLMQAREGGTKIVVIDPKYTDSAAVFGHRWIPIRPGTDGAMLLAMAYVTIEEGLQDQHFLDTYTLGFDRFKHYVEGLDDAVPKTPAWAEAITGVDAVVTAELARDYATIKPAALLAGIAPGRTAYGEQYHRIAITLAAMTGNIGIHGGDAAGRAWESVFVGYPYKMSRQIEVPNPVDQDTPDPPRGSPWRYRVSRIHRCKVPDMIEKGRKGGYPADCRMITIVNSNYLNSFPNVNKIVRALKSKKVEFIWVQEQFMTPTAKFADILLPTNTFLERNDIANGVGLPFYGCVKKAIDSLGESKSHIEIAELLASRLGVPGTGGDRNEENRLKEMIGGSDIRDYDDFRRRGLYRIQAPEPHVAFQQQIKDPSNHPFPTPSGKIEIYSSQLADRNHPEIPPIPTYIETWESRNDPLASRYPLQLITTHFRRRANAQFDNIPWLRELETHGVYVNTADAEERGIRNGEMVRVFNDRGEVLIPARVTERIMPGVVDVPHGAWYAPDGKGVDRGGCANVLTKDASSPAGGFAFNTALVQVERA